MTPNEAEKKSAAVYVSWTTFKNVVMDGLSKSMPNVIDKSVFDSQAGGVQGQLMAAIKFLGLIDEKGRPTKALDELAQFDEAARKKALARLLKEHYAEVFALGVEKATPKQLSDALSTHYSVNGETLDKATRFFLAAVKYAGIAVSPLLAKAKGGTEGRRRSTKRARVEESVLLPPIPPAPPGAATGTSRTINLKGGGSVTVMVSIDVLNLKGDDRAFVFNLSDTLDDYENKVRSMAPPPPPPPPPAPPLPPRVPTT